MFCFDGKSMITSNRATVFSVSFNKERTAVERHFFYVYGDNTYGQFGAGHRHTFPGALLKVRLVDRIVALSGYENYAASIGESEGLWHWGNGPLRSGPGPALIPVGGAKFVGLCSGKPGVLAWGKNFVSLFDAAYQRTSAMKIKKAVAYEDTFLVLTEDGCVVKADEGRTLFAGATDLAGAGTWASLAVADTLQGRAVIHSDQVTLNAAVPTDGIVLVRPGKILIVKANGDVLEATEATNFTDFNLVSKPSKAFEVISAAALDNQIILYTTQGLVACPGYLTLSTGSNSQTGATITTN